MAEQVRVGGVWLNDVAPWGDLTYSTSWPRGCDEASWSIYLPPGVRDERVRRGALVEISDSGTGLWLGTLTQADWAAGSFTADGLYVDAAFSALDAVGNATTIPSLAVDQAIARGARWTGRSGIPAAAITASDTSDKVNTAAELLDAAADLYGQRWGVFADGILTMDDDATAPSWHLTASAVDLGEDDGTYASRLQARYLRGSDNTYQTVTVEDAQSIATYGAVEEPIDLTGWGPISTASATQITTNILNRSRRSIGWTNALDVSPYQLTTVGGAPADLSMVRAGQVVRAFDVWNGRLVLPYVDLLLGKVTRDTTSRTINLAPVDTQPQTLSEIIESLQPKEES